MKNIYLKQHFSNVIKYFEYGIDIVMNTFKNIFIHRIITEKIWNIAHDICINYPLNDKELVIESLTRDFKLQELLLASLVLCQADLSEL